MEKSFRGKFSEIKYPLKEFKWSLVPNGQHETLSADFLAALFIHYKYFFLVAFADFQEPNIWALRLYTMVQYCYSGKQLAETR